MSEYVRNGRDGFGRSRELFEALVSALADRDAGDLTHAQLEERLSGRGRVLLCQLMQDRLDLQAARE